MTTPRHNAGHEQAVLGALMLDRTGEVIDEITAILKPEHFYHPKHATIYRQILHLHETGPVDALTVTAAFEPAELTRLGGAPYLHSLLQAVPTVANGTWYAREVRNLAQLRAMQEHALAVGQMASSAATSAVEHILDRVHASAVDLVTGAADTAAVPTWNTTAGEAVDEMERAQQWAAKGELPGIPTGWPDMDRLLQNLHGGQLVVIAGRPGMGKSIAGRQIALYNAVQRKTPSLIFSLEMSRTECALALISAGAGVPLTPIRGGHLDDQQWTRIARYLGATRDAPLLIDDTAAATLAHARSTLRQLTRAGTKPGVLIWDYLQLTPADGYPNRQEAVSALSRGFKLLAKEFDIPVVLISQLNRGPEQRADKRPALADLRESGAVEQDADVVILLHRDDYYDKESPRAGEVDFIVAKNRHGSTDTVTLAAQLHLQRMMSLAA